MASRWLNGSSMSSRSGSTEKRAIPTLCCIPPEWAGYICSNPQPSRVPGGPLAVLIGFVAVDIHEVVDHGSPGSSRGSWNTYPSVAGEPSSAVTNTDPEVGVSTPETMLRKVLFPQPDGPTMVTKVWPDISKSIPSSALTVGWCFVGGGTP